MNTFKSRIVSFSLALAFVLGLAGLAAAGPHDEAMMNLSPEKQEIVRKLHEDYYNSTREARKELLSKRHELDALLYSANPDEKRIQALTREISDLRSSLYNARISLKGKLIKEDIPFGGGYGHGRGHGKGRGKGPFCDGAGHGGRGPFCDGIGHGGRGKHGWW
jgi:zinc resistance-associated protein